MSRVKIMNRRSQQQQQQQPQQGFDDEEEDVDQTKGELASEIARIEQELKRKRLEEEIRRMEQMIAAHKSASELNFEADEEEIIEEVYDDENEGDEILIEEYDDDVEYEEGSYIEEDDMSYEEEIIEDDGEILDEEEEYEVEYVDEDEEYDDGYGDFGGNESQMMQGNDFNSSVVMADPMWARIPEKKTIAPAAPAPKPAPAPVPAPPAPSVIGVGLMDAVKGAATKRNARLEEDPSELKMKEYQQNEKPARPVDTFDFTAMVSQAARDREARLEAGGEKKMTEIKSKSEYRKEFNDVAIEAAQLGRLTRLHEHVIETVAVEKTKEEEWRSKGLLAIQWRNQHMAVIHEAARAGAASKLPEKICTNYVVPEEVAEDEYDEDEWDFDESKVSTRRVSERLKQLMQPSAFANAGGHGTGQNKVDEMIAERKEEKLSQTRDMAIKPMIYYCEDINKVKLPRRKTPQIDPKKELEKIKVKFRGTYQMDRPLSNISNEVAERAWARRTRLDRPGSMPRVLEICHCPYCVDPSPMQTQAYKNRDKERKEAGYESPNSEDERKKAREKRRLERRKNRMGGRGGDDDDEQPTATTASISTTSSNEGTEAATPTIRVRRSRRGTEGAAPSAITSSTTAVDRQPVTAPAPAKSKSIISAELASMMESVSAVKLRTGPPRVRTTSGRIGAAAKQFSEARAPVEDTPEEDTPKIAIDNNDGEADKEKEPKTKKVVRRRRKSGDSVDSEDSKTPKTRATKSKRPAGTTTATTTTTRRPSGAKVAAAESSGKRVVRKKSASSRTSSDDQEKEETIITKPDGTRVIRRKVKVKKNSAAVAPTAEPETPVGRVVTKKVVRTVGGKKKITTVVENSAGAPAPAPETTTTTPGPTKTRSVTKTAAAAPAPATTTTTTTTRVRRSAAPGTRHFASSGSIPAVTTTTVSAAPKTSTTAVAPTTPTVGSPTTVTVTREGPAGSRIVTTTTTTTTKRVGAPPRTKSGFFGRKK